MCFKCIPTVSIFAVKIQYGFDVNGVLLGTKEFTRMKIEPKRYMNSWKYVFGKIVGVKLTSIQMVEGRRRVAGCRPGIGSSRRCSDKVVSSFVR